MSELEMELGRTLGASSFYVFQFIKNNPGATSRDVEIETGLSPDTVHKCLRNLRETNILKFTEKVSGYRKSKRYSENKEKDTWKLH